MTSEFLKGLVERWLSAAALAYGKSSCCSGFSS